MDYLDYRNIFLAHHGILGQKWGIRRFQDYDGVLTAAGRIRYGVGNGNGLSREIRESTAKTRFETRLTTYREWLNKSAKEGYSQDFMPLFRAMRGVNPNYSTGKEEYTRNCGYCALTYEAHRRGYSGEAPGDTRGLRIENIAKDVYGLRSSDCETFRRSITPYTPGFRSVSSYCEKIRTEMLAGGIGSRGLCSMAWNGIYYGHIQAYEVIEGPNGEPVVILVDGQVDDIFLLEEIVGDTWEFVFFRTDNLPFDEDSAKKYVPSLKR